MDNEITVQFYYVYLDDSAGSAFWVPMLISGVRLRYNISSSTVDLWYYKFRHERKQKYISQMKIQ